ncbi:MAG: hypothetical protein WBA39_09655 [Rivularia sp. (in: cyanobacteria)]
MGRGGRGGRWGDGEMGRWGDKEKNITNFLFITHYSLLITHYSLITTPNFLNPKSKI